MYTWLLSLFTLVNIIASAYMTFLTLQLAWLKCKCAVFNAYFIVIALYFLFSVVFLFYTMLMMYGRVSGFKLIHLMSFYIIITIIFIGATYMYTHYLTGKNCNCVSQNYHKLLKLITLIRILSILIMGVSMISWGVYALLGQYNFINKK